MCGPFLDCQQLASIRIRSSMKCNTSRKFRAVRAIVTAPDADRVCQRAGSLRFSHPNEKRNRAHRTGPASHIGEQKKRLKEKRTEYISSTKNPFYTNVSFSCSFASTLNNSLHAPTRPRICDNQGFGSRSALWRTEECSDRFPRRRCLASYSYKRSNR